MNSNRSIQICGGFTAIELLIVVGIIGIFAAFAVPAFANLVRQTRATAAATNLTGDLQLARSEAIKRNVRVLVCRTTNGATCSTGSAWDSGWLVCYDRDANAQCDPANASGPNPIRSKAALSSIALTGPTSSFWFAATGNMVTAASGPPSFNVNNNQHVIQVQASGAIGRP